MSYVKLTTRQLRASALVLTAWRMGIWFAKTIVEQLLMERAQMPVQWELCPVCGTRLVSKGFVKRRMLTLVGWVEWKRRIGRCPRQVASRLVLVSRGLYPLLIENH